MEKKKERLVAAIEKGTVIDHIPAQKTFQVAQLLGLIDSENQVTIGNNYASEKVGKKGVVRDPAVHEEVIRGVLDFARETGFACTGLTFSPITGPEGNIEYLACFAKGENGSAQPDEDSIGKTVREAHGTLLSKGEQGGKWTAFM